MYQYAIRLQLESERGWTVKAIRVYQFGAPEVMRIEDVPDPAPGHGQLVVRIHAAGVNPIDTYIRSGLYAVKPSLPYTPGRDGAGVVEAAGEGVSRFKPGDRVYLSGVAAGTYCEKTICNDSEVHPLPSQVSYEQGAGLGVPYSAAFRALYQRAKCIPGEVLLIHGASGGVGIAAIQFARASGMTIIGTAGTAEGRDLVMRQGAHHVLDHHSTDYLKQVLAITNAKGVNVILEMLANVNLGKDLGVLARQGRVIVVGSRGTVEIDPRATMALEACIMGMTVLNAAEGELKSIHAAIGAGLENGTLRPVVGKTLPLAGAPESHRTVIESSAHGKIVLIP